MTAYGDGAPSYEDAEVQRLAIEGRLRVAVGIRDRARASGNARRVERWEGLLGCGAGGGRGGRDL